MAFDVKAVLTSVQADVYKIEVLSAFGGAPSLAWLCVF